MHCYWHYFLVLCGIPGLAIFRKINPAQSVINWTLGAARVAAAAALHIWLSAGKLNLILLSSQLAGSQFPASSFQLPASSYQLPSWQISEEQQLQLLKNQIPNCQLFVFPANSAPRPAFVALQDWPTASEPQVQ